MTKTTKMTKTEKPERIETEIPCEDCGLKVYQHTVEGCWKDPYTRNHKGLCCDCYDETYWGMPASSRSRPRP